MNARFWVWHNDGWVKLTLRLGQSLSVWGGGPDDEGPSYWSTTWSYMERDNGRLYVDCVREQWGSDCDGRYSSTSEWWCAVERLRKVFINVEKWGDHGLVPDWQAGRSSQRDYSAEAMNY